jgi:hypothetical protein
VIFASPSSTFTCTAEFSTGGLVGTVGVRIISGTGTTIKSRVTTGITEPIASSGFYVASINLATLSAAPAPGHYYVFWDDGATTPGHIAGEDLYISGASSLSTALRNIQAVANTTSGGDNFTVGIFVP